MEPDNTYKEIIYLDEVELTSALAQLEGGLKQSLQATDSTGNGVSETNAVSSHTKGNIGAAILSATYGSSWENTTAQINNESASQAMNVVFKDYQLERLLSLLENKRKLVHGEAGDGEFFLATGNFRVVDFSSIRNVLGDNTLKNVMTKLPHTEGETKPWSKDVESSFKLLGSFSTLVDKMLPSTSIFSLDGSVAYAENSNLRIQSGQLGPIQATSREIKILGIVDGFVGSKQLNSDEVSQSIGQGDLGYLGNLVTSLSEMVLTSFNIIQKGDKLIKPIAIYFEND